MFVAAGKRRPTPLRREAFDVQFGHSPSDLMTSRAVKIGRGFQATPSAQPGFLYLDGGFSASLSGKYPIAIAFIGEYTDSSQVE
jgi:hypothetical protein